MSLSRSVTCIAIIAAAVSSPAIAQPSGFPPADPIRSVISPDAWLAYPEGGKPAVRISKTASDGATLFAGGCDKRAGPVVNGVISGYGAAGLKRLDGEIERVLFEVSTEDWKEAFAVQLRYDARSRSWAIANPLAAVFVGSFARGAKLVIRNAQWQEVVSFDLTGSSAAARTMRAVCGMSS